MCVYFIFGKTCIKCTQPISKTKGCCLLGSNAVSFMEVPAFWINMLPQVSGQNNGTVSYVYLVAKEVHVLMTSRIGCGENKTP